MKGLRNGISCSTGSELTLAIVRSYYRLLAAKADNAASRSGKTRALSGSPGGRKSTRAVRVFLPLLQLRALPGKMALPVDGRSAAEVGWGSCWLFPALLATSQGNQSLTCLRGDEGDSGSSLLVLPSCSLLWLLPSC